MSYGWGWSPRSSRQNGLLPGPLVSHYNYMVSLVAEDTTNVGCRAATNIKSSGKLPPCWLAFLVPECAMLAAGGRASMTSYSPRPYMLNTNMLRKVWPPLQQWHKWHGATSCFLIGYETCSTGGNFMPENFVNLVCSPWLGRAQAPRKLLLFFC